MNQALFQKNYSLLPPPLRSIFASGGLDARLEVVPCRKVPVPTLKAALENGKQHFLHSRYDPLREADQFAQSCFVPAKDMLLAGFGLGYHVEALLARLGEDQTLVVIVLNNDVFSAALALRDLSHVLQHPRLMLVADQGVGGLARETSRLMETYQEMACLIHQPSLEALLPDRQPFGDIFASLVLDRRTTSLDREELLENVSANLATIVGAQPVHHFGHAFRGRPVFVVAAGPSLDRNISELMKVGNRGLIVSTGTALNPLLAAGIIPDLIVALDIKPCIEVQLAPARGLNLPLLFLPGINAKALARHVGKKVIAFPENDPLFAMFDQVLNKGFLDTGGSVANLALHFAHFCGGSPTVLVGQDLAIGAQGQTHAHGVLTAGEPIDPAFLMKIEGLFGPLLTLKNLYRYLRWTESFIKARPGATFINATEGGARISGCAAMKLRHVLHQTLHEPFDKALLHRPYHFDQSLQRQHIEKLREVLAGYERPLDAPSLSTVP